MAIKYESPYNITIERALELATLYRDKPWTSREFYRLAMTLAQEHAAASADPTERSRYLEIANASKRALKEEPFKLENRD